MSLAIATMSSSRAQSKELCNIAICKAAQQVYLASISVLLLDTTSKTAPVMFRHFVGMAGLPHDV